MRSAATHRRAASVYGRSPRFAIPEAVARTEVPARGAPTEPWIPPMPDCPRTVSERFVKAVDHRLRSVDAVIRRPPRQRRRAGQSDRRLHRRRRRQAPAPGVLRAGPRLRLRRPPAASKPPRSSSSSIRRRCCTTTSSTARPAPRPRDTANNVWGNAASVLVGDLPVLARVPDDGRSAACA